MNLHQALVKVQTDFKNSQQNVYNYFDLLASRKLTLMPKMVEIHGFGKDKPIAIDTKSNTAKQFLNEVLTNKDGLYINSIETTAENKLVYKANNFDINTTLIQIANNAAVKGDVVADKVRRSTVFSKGYDAVKNTYVDMFEAGIVDPAKVIRSALENAANVSASLLTTEVAIVPKKEHPHTLPTQLNPLK